MIELILVSMATAASLGVSEPVVFVDDQAVMRVKLSGYDFSNAEDRHRLERKIRWASRKVCDARIPGGEQVEIFACTKDTIGSARQQLDTILAQHRSGVPVIAAITISAVNR